MREALPVDPIQGMKYRPSAIAAVILVGVAGLALGQQGVRQLGALLRDAQSADAAARVEARAAQSTAIREQAEADASADRARRLREVSRVSARRLQEARAAYDAAVAAGSRPVGGEPQGRPVPPPMDEPIEPPVQQDPLGRPSAPFGDPLSEPNMHAYATQTVAQNKLQFVPAKRASRSLGPPRERVRQTFTFRPNEAPDMADMDIFGTSQWCLNVARGGVYIGKPLGSVPKTGNVDLARLSLQPAPNYKPWPGSDWRPDENMKWGARRYNMGDLTVVDCDVSDIPWEHGFYDSAAGHALYRGCTFLRLGGQALQIAHRDKPYPGYTTADNMPFTARPICIVEDCHAVDVGMGASKGAFAWTFFDFGSMRFPGTIIVRDSTLVTRFTRPRTNGTNAEVPVSHPQAIQAAKAFVAHNYQQQASPGSYATDWFVVDNCLFDLTQNDGPFAAVRGVRTVLIEDSTFLARNSRNGFLDIDDRGVAPSGTLILENNVSPAESRVFLRIRSRKVMHNGAAVSLHQPGRRLEIDIATLKVTEGPVQYDQITDLQSPLHERAGNIPSGITPQPAGHVDDMGEVTPTYRKAG